MILPLGERTGAETDATPCSRSPTDCAQPRRRMPDSAAAEKAAFWRPRCIRSGSSQASSTWAAEPARMVSWEPTGMVSRSPDGRSAAATQTRYVALAPPQLGGLAGDVAQPGQHGSGGRQQPVLAGGGGQLGQPRTEDEAALHVAGHETVVLERDGEAVRGRPGQAGAGDQTGQGGRPRLEGGEHEGGLVEDADAGSAAGTVHMAILPSQIMGCKVYARSQFE